jgi:8-oxo-dGTP pyrophosphatase MutT (NUDIX family)
MPLSIARRRTYERPVDRRGDPVLDRTGTRRSTMIPDARHEVDLYLERHPEDRARLGLLLSQMESGEDYGARSNMRGHAVSSIMTLDRTRRRTLLILHGAYGVWIPPGGHYEAPGTLHDSGLRELAEETGLNGTRSPLGRPLLIDIDTHAIPARPEKGEGPHFHHDFMYLELLDVDFEPSLQEDEVRGGGWRDLEKLAVQPGRMSRLAERIRALPPAILA